MPWLFRKQAVGIRACPYAGLRHGCIFFAQSRGELEHNHSMLMAILAGARGRIVQFPNEGPPPRSIHLPDQATWISMGHGMGRVVALPPKKPKPRSGDIDLDAKSGPTEGRTFLDIRSGDVSLVAVAYIRTKVSRDVGYNLIIALSTPPEKIGSIG